MADRVLRDQCEHGRYEAHSWGYKPETDGTYGCPGGQEVTLTEERPNMYYEAKHRGVEIVADRRWVTKWGPV